jgi:hypothetical protein
MEIEQNQMYWNKREQLKKSKVVVWISFITFLCKGIKTTILVAPTN